jgi:catechol 2,3-dioxygenase-like lactoylglutathione lyase family enzyme
MSVKIKKDTMTLRISRIILFVADVPRAAAFYQRHFGLEPVGPEEEGWLELRAGGCNLALHHGKLPPGEQSHSPVKIVFAVNNVRDAVKQFAANGLKFGEVHEWNGISFADTKDPEGNPIQISSGGIT